VSEKRISVIIPVYNREKFLEACISSVLNQEDVNTEIILINDGSTDFSGQICDKYAAKYDNIYVFHTENHGVSHARNIGLNNANGDYVCFLDSDDSFNAEALFSLQTAIEKYNADYAIGKMEFFTDNGEFITKTNIPTHFFEHPLSRYDVLTMMAEADCRVVIGVTAKLFKMDIWRTLRFCEDAVVAEDDLMLPQILERINSVVVIDKAVYHVVQSKNSLIRSKVTMNNLKDSSFASMDYCISQKHFEAALFRFGLGTRNLLRFKKELTSKEAIIKIKELYKEYCRYAKLLSPHVNMKNKLRFALFRTNLDLYSFIQSLGN
jgi:glycosyltransferase involved in cell wall biosynthesis